MSLCSLREPWRGYHPGNEAAEKLTTAYIRRVASPSQCITYTIAQLCVVHRHCHLYMIPNADGGGGLTSERPGLVSHALRNDTSGVSAALNTQENFFFLPPLHTFVSFYDTLSTPSPGGALSCHTQVSSETGTTGPCGVPGSQCVWMKVVPHASSHIRFLIVRDTDPGKTSPSWGMIA